MIHHVYANRSNIGDWLAARGIQQLLRPLAIREHLCDAPFVDATLAELARAESDDVIVIGGGGLLMDYFASFWEGLRRIRPRAPICLWGLGYCDLKGEMSHPPLEPVRYIAEHAALCVVRDQLTRDHLAGCNVAQPVACPSLTVVENKPRGREFLHVDNYTTVGPAAYEAMDRICEAYADDRGRLCFKTNNRIEPGRESDLARILSLYERADVVVSSGLHGCIIAAAMGRPVIAVSGDRKIDAFMQMAGLGDWVLEPSQVHELPHLLSILPEQPLQPVAAFIEEGRTQNAAIAEHVKRIAGERGGDVGSAT